MTRHRARPAARGEIESVFIVTPARAGTRLGNRVTALRWQRILRELGYRVHVGTRWSARQRCDVLVALHATKSADSIRAFRTRHPLAPVVLALTGTDLYTDLRRDHRTRASIELASRLVVLQREALRELDATSRKKARVIVQSASPARGPARRKAHGLRVIAISHLRRVKDPLLAARAVRMLPSGSKVRIDHYGSVLDAATGRAARRESAANPRWQWRGERQRAVVLRTLAASDVFVQTSLAEGGSSALAEAVVSGVAVLATRIPGTVGMLGRAHPGLFAAGNAFELARLLRRCETDPRFLKRLRGTSARVAPRFDPERELVAWMSLLAELRNGVTRSRNGRIRTAAL
jgi:putative glycosyltransferase (TIGR04348 family)